MPIPSQEVLLKILALVCLLAVALTLLPWITFWPPRQRSSFRFWTLPESGGSISTENPQDEPLIVHYVWFHRNQLQPAAVTFLDCLGVLSVMKNLRPDVIFVHTDVPDFWPFDPCNAIISNWTGLQLVPAHRSFVVGGKRIHFVEHEADIIKLKLLRQYGGLALDFDVYLINGTKFREVYHAHPCVLSEERHQRLNNGFVACRRGAVYPQMILQESYVADYQPDQWVYNIGVRTYQLYHQHEETGYVQEGISDRPEWDRRLEFLTGPERKHEWRDKIAHHSFLHDASYALESIERDDSSMGDMLNWILSS
ncbi:hypothetical protein BV898_15260 [Hypsibius exemplaris]|uniref:Uncharacterized protein n=1 Tax=Hypsibius exemplaris TaxID=2072580 RepID=A0A9X6NJY2_HYPEX|nr:hypothetical protein BV898_15260 [Hypsibius exemplaris]